MRFRSTYPAAATSELFRLAHTTGVEPGALVQACLAQLGPLPADANLGFIYASDALARELEALVRLLKQATGIESWVGSVGVAISVTGHEYYDQPVLAVMVGSVPPEGLHLIPSLTAGIEGFRAECGEWLSVHQPHFGIVHGDPTNPATPSLLYKLAEDTGAFFVGGITSSQSQNLQVSGGIVRGGISGVLFDQAVEVLTSHTQGCAPIGPKHRITHAVGNVLAELDGTSCPGRVQGGHRPGPREGPPARRRLYLRGAADRRLGYQRLHGAQPYRDRPRAEAARHR